MSKFTTIVNTILTSSAFAAFIALWVDVTAQGGIFWE